MDFGPLCDPDFFRSGDHKYNAGHRVVKWRASEALTTLNKKINFSLTLSEFSLTNNDKIHEPKPTMSP